VAVADHGVQLAAAFGSLLMLIEASKAVGITADQVLGAREQAPQPSL
jgi:hypothetical protein